MSRSPDPRRILVMAAGLSALGVASMFAARPDEVMPAVLPATWLDLEAVPSDPRGLATRRVTYRSIQQQRNAEDALALTCGSDAPAATTEEYRALIGDWVLQEHARVWRVTLVPQGAMMLAKVEPLVWPPPPPPPPPPGDDSSPPEIQGPGPIRTSMVPIVDLEPVRSAWSAAALWTPQDPFVSCLDGRPAFFEACIRGRYFASEQGCASEADQLWAAMQARLPAP